MTEHGGAKLRDPGEPMRERFVKHLKEENFVLFCQAIVPVRPSSAEPDFREIFVRYREEEQSLLPPGSFLPILEDQGLLPFLDRWVVFRLLQWCRETATSAPVRPAPRCSVNLSIDTVRRDGAFGDYVLNSLEKAGVRGESLSFEIPTADAIAHRAPLARMIPALRAAGCTFALSGFPSDDEAAFELATFLGVAFAKLDGKFAATHSRDPATRAKLAPIIQRCRNIGVRTIGTSVEDVETWDQLRMLNIDYVQGFGIERPRPL